MIKAILFDMDGTLVDSERAHFEAWRHVLAKYDFLFSLHDYYLCVGKSVEVISEMLAQKLQNGAPPKELADQKREYYRMLQRKGLPPVQETLSFLHRLKREKEKRGLKFALASAEQKKAILINLENLGITSYFDLILSGEDDLSHYNDPEGVNKPKPYIYLEAARLFNCSPKECVVIEDSEPGLLAGLRAGCITVVVPNPYTKSHDLSQAHLSFDSLENMEVENFLRITSKLQ